MRLKSRLNHWHKAGLIDENQIGEIIAHEKNKTAGRFTLALQLVGMFAIMLGISLVIASNWRDIGPYTKLIVHFIFNAGLSVWIYKLGPDGGNKPILKECLCLALFGANLTFIALIGQVFQLEGSTAGALILWMILSAPMMIAYARKGFTAWIWTIALYLTFFYGFIEFKPEYDDFKSALIAYFLVIFVPMALYADQCVAFTRLYRPAFAEAFRKTSLVILPVTASISGLMFYGAGDEIRDEAGSMGAYYLFFGIILAGAFGYFAFLRRYFGFIKDNEDDWNVILFSLIAFSISILVPIEGDMLGAALTIGLWLALGAHWQKTGHEGLVSLAITIVTIRLFIIFLELFGGLLQTGIGMIFAGIVMILMARGALYFRRHLKEALS